jgi:hypothetical protein
MCANRNALAGQLGCEGGQLPPLKKFLGGNKFLLPPSITNVFRAIITPSILDQERLSALALIHIEKDITIDIDKIVAKFVMKNETRKRQFSY